ncbi:N-acetylglucosamine kinase [Parafilimonas sp.]|uniref:N-acetylglucosamine kinase n=1 Tax=Parafilimonas sp. TaxID=1969739 RepID=UPI0039E481FB
MAAVLIADSGSTKCEWRLVKEGKSKKIFTTGISPYFLSGEQIQLLLQKELLPKIKDTIIDELFYYGTGLKDDANKKFLKSVLKKVFPATPVEVQTDLLGAARALSLNEKGVCCILGTGSNSCYYNGKKIIKNSPGIGYVLGDEGSGAYLGKKVIQYFLYNTFDEELMHAFNKKYNTNADEIITNVYTKPQPNRYLASFALFLAENRGHYMIENIIEDSLNDFFFTHLSKYTESWLYPIHFTGSISFGFKDVLKTLCSSYEMEMGAVLKEPMDGLVKYHSM